MCAKITNGSKVKDKSFRERKKYLIASDPFIIIIITIIVVVIIIIIIIIIRPDTDFDRTVCLSGYSFLQFSNNLRHASLCC